MSSQPTPVVIGLAFVILIGLPVLAIIDARRAGDLEEAAGHRRSLYLSVATSLLFIALVTLGVTSWQGVPPEALGWNVGDLRTAIAWSLGVTAAGLALLWALTMAAHRAGLEESPVAMLLMPRTASETRGFLILSGVAGLCEEYVFRGFGLWAVGELVGSPWLAAGLVSISFGLAHGYQKLAGVLRAGTLGMLLAVPIIWTGSLFPSIVGHFWINAAVGLGGWRYLLPGDDDEASGVHE